MPRSLTLIDLDADEVILLPAEGGEDHKVHP